MRCMSEAATPVVPGAREGMAWVPDGEFQMGSEAVSYTHLTLPTTPYV